MALTDYLHDEPIEPAAPAETEQTPHTGSNIKFTGQDAQSPAPKPKKRHHFWTWFFIIILVALGGTFWVRYCNPYVTDAQVRGFVVMVEKRGIIFKTFEGEMMRKAALDDTTSIYSRDFSFSIDNDSLAMRVQSFAGTRQQVLVTYRSYYGALPWRGASRNILEAIEPVDNR